ncbi:MAG: alpha/beta hydrolase-fold protein [Bacteroidota bacterium]
MKTLIPLFLFMGTFLISNPSLSAQALENRSNQPYETAIVDSLYSNTLKEYRRFWVKFPENYNPNNKEKYPVVYLLDGFSLKNNLETVYENYWGHYLPHMILVGISNESNRTRDLTTTQVKMRRGAQMDAATGGATNFSKFIRNELIPQIDKIYPTTPYRTLMGHSYAGLFTIHMLLEYPGTFKNYIAMDPSIEWDQQEILRRAKEKLVTEKYKGRSLFISLAAEQLHMFDASITIENIMEDTSEFTLFARSIIEFSKFAESKAKGLNFSWKIYPEDLHGTVPLPSMRDGLVTLFEWYQFKSPQVYNNPDTSLETIEQLLKEQGKIYTAAFGYKVPPMAEEMLNGYGYMNLQMGQPDKAFLFFQTNIDYFPNSANAYDSMADFYESKNDKAKALVFVTKAFELSGSDYYKQRMKRLGEKK